MNPQPLHTLLDLSGKTVIVTGAVGIGYGIAYRMAEAHANVMIASNKEDELQQSVSTLQSSGANVRGMTIDVSREDQVQFMVAETVKTFGGIDILVNNAGIYPNIPISQMTLENFQKVLSVNLNGVFLTTKYVSEQMKAQGRGGRIINITSIDALHPSGIGLAHYDASKHGVWGFTKNAALELSSSKIWVNAIAPGGIQTPGVEAQQKNAPSAPGVDMEKIMNAFLQKIPMKRLGDPDDIGKVALFLASEMASYITGTQIVVDGGVLLS